MENNNKKTLILSIVGILVLVIAVVGVSFAMFTFTGTGTKENVIKTGTITVDFGDTASNKIEVTNKYPSTDAAGLADNNSTTFKVVGSWGTQKMTVNYELGLADIVEGDTLGEEDVKVQILKGKTPVMGTATAGALISSIADQQGTLSGTPFNATNGHYVTSGTLTNQTAATTNLTDTYTVKVYVADTYSLPDDASKSTNPEVAGGTVNNASGTLHQKTSGSETLSFKVRVYALQA